MSHRPDKPVSTGVEDDGRRISIRLLVGALGWILLGAAVVYLASDPTLEALDVAVFLVTAITLFTVIAVLAGLQLRDDLMRERMIPPETASIDGHHDILGRPVEPPEPDLTGVVVLETVDGRRLYRRVTE